MRANKYVRAWAFELGTLPSIFGTAFQEFAAAHREWRSSRRVATRQPPPQFPIAAGFIIAGAAYFVLFAPLAYLSGARLGADPVGIVLLQTLPPGLKLSALPYWWSASARPTAYALAALWGALILSSGLLVLAGGLPKVVLSTTGLFLGYVLTAPVLQLLGQVPPGLFQGRIFLPRFAYIIVIYYLASALSTIFGGEGYERDRYDSLFLGVAALLVSALLVRGFGTASQSFAGAVFLIVTFFTTYLFEHLYLPLLIVMRKRGGEDVLAVMESERRTSLRALRVALRQRTAFDTFVIRLVAIGLIVWPAILALGYYSLVKAIT